MIMNRILYVLCLCIAFNIAQAQTHKTENVVIVTLDGMRWQEVFGGADSVLINNINYTKDTADVKSKFWSNDADDRRKKLFPFLWSTVAQQGQLFGNPPIQQLREQC